jgi:formate hydrogenlyase subunit 3/multisubunit Na+/H+ antiporter MnhD subunit
MDRWTSADTRDGRRPLVGLFSEVWRDSATLIRKEAELAKTEIAEKMAEAGTGIASMAVGGVICFAGFLLVLFAAVGVLAMALPEEHAPWLAPLIVGVVVLAAGGMLLLIGRNKLRNGNFKPSRTTRSVRRDAEVVKEHLT